MGDALSCAFAGGRGRYNWRGRLAMTVQHLGSMTWREVKAFVHDRVVACVPIGSIVAHGPHLPLNTDVVISVEAVRRASRRLSQNGVDVLVLPPVVYSPARLGSKFAGTIDLSAEAFSATLRGLLEGIKGMGVRTACLFTCHMDPDHLQAVRGVVAGCAGDPRLRVLFPDLALEPWSSRMPEEFRRGGSHGGRYETACIMALEEDKVREEIRKRLTKVEADMEAAVREGKGHYADCGGLQAYFGDPASATPQDGEAYLETLAGIIADIATLGRA